MSNIPENQIGDWLKKLERESWQLELLVSAFTIFLLIAAGREFKEYINDLQYRYNISSGTLSFIYLFLNLVQKSIQALTVCLVGHLMLRGFWIGTIGLRSVQSSIDFSKLNYNTFFTDKLKKKVISLDRMVVKLDEICSVIFAFAFLVISILMAFGLYLLLMASVVVFLQTLVEITPDWTNESVGIASIIIAFTLLFTGIIYMLDYFTLGFFKKIKWLAKIYYPFYRFYNFITIAVLSRSIYYYMISKFSKKKIRWIYAIGGTIMFFSLLIEFDQHQYYPDATNDLFAPVNSYDNLRPEGDYVYGVSIASNYIDKPHFQVFLRYDVTDNVLMQSHCDDFVPLKGDGLN